jgi:hypothetical protein
VSARCDRLGESGDLAIERREVFALSRVIRRPSARREFRE